MIVRNSPVAAGLRKLKAFRRGKPLPSIRNAKKETEPEGSVFSTAASDTGKAGGIRCTSKN
jgi:hypothetical protein